MANIHIQKWEETPGERSLRERGHASKDIGIIETGITTGAFDTRADRVGGLMKRVANCLWELRQKMAEMKWDDDRVCLVIGIQIRNKWEQAIDGEWVEIGSVAWLDKQAQNAMRK